LANYSNSSNLIFHTISIEKNVYLTKKENVYLGIKKINEDGSDILWISNSRDHLFNDNQVKAIKIPPENQCIDREKLKRIYEDRKRELGDGPEPNHYIGIGQGFHSINRDSVIMRDAPSMQGRVVQTLRRGQTVAVIDHASQEMRIDPFGTSHWLKIRLENHKVGYIFGTFVQWKEDFPPGYKIED
ncbi:SH3 domain-containing protein, partial [Leptospira bourretii]